MLIAPTQHAACGARSAGNTAPPAARTARANAAAISPGKNAAAPPAAIARKVRARPGLRKRWPARGAKTYTLIPPSTQLEAHYERLRNRVTNN